MEDKTKILIRVYDLMSAYNQGLQGEKCLNMKIRH